MSTKFSVPQCTVVVAIGRNIGNEPMFIRDWKAFRQQIADTIGYFGGDLVLTPELRNEYCNSIGVWDSVKEDSACFIAFVPAQAVHGLRERLIEIRKAYSQQSISFIHLPGTAHFV